ncbi:MAG TPA: PAS domain-containing protein [Flavisolibacter sp.]|nr:PAS domain-containing protein [Flavisolibacter sp.]
MKNQPADILSADPSLSVEDALRVVLNNIEDMLMLVDKSLCLVATNVYTKEKIRQYFGLSITEGMNVLKLTSPDNHAFFKLIYAEVFGGGTRQIETEAEFEGNLHNIEIHFRPARGRQGEIIGALVRLRNITENKKSQAALKELEERWRFAIEGGKQGVWDWNMKNNEIFYSSSYKRLYGYADDEMSNHIDEWRSMIHPDDKASVDKALAIHLGSPETFYEHTYRIRAKDGSYRWILSRGMIISHDAEGKPLRMIGTHTDISEQMHTKEQLRMSEQQYRTLFESNPLPCWIYDSENLRFLEVNRAAIEHYGFSKAEFLASGLYDIHPEDQLPKLEERLRTQKTKKNIAYNNWKHKRKNGEPIFVDLRINSITYRGRDAKLVVAHDVTAKVLAENELRKSNERFLYAAKASSEALWEWNVDTEEFYISAAYTDIFGWKMTVQHRFDEWHDYIHPQERKQTIDSFYSAIQDTERQHWSREYQYLKADGTYAVVIDKAVILRNEAGKAVKIIGAMQDVTAQKKAEAELKQSNERFSLVSRATSDAIYDWDIQSGQLLWGDGIHTLFGFQPDEVPIDRWEKLIHPNDRSRVANTLSISLSQPKREFWKEEYRFAKANGGYSYVLDRGFIMRDEQGRAIRVIGSMQDITARKYNEDLLSLERSIYELSSNPTMELRHIVLKLLKGIEALHEDAYCSVLLLRQDDRIEPFAAPRLSPAFTKYLYGLAIGPEEGSCGAAMATKQIIISSNIDTDPAWNKYRSLVGQFGIKACWSLPIIHSQGRVMGSFAIYFMQPRSPLPAEMATMERMRNILRVLMENNWWLNQIKAANERFDIMMKATHDLIWDWNLENNFIYRDEMGLKKVYGVESNESIHTIYQWLGRIHPDDHSRVEKVISEILQAVEQDTFEVEYRFMRDDGGFSHVYDRGMIIRNAEGKPVRMIGAAQDITERKRLEQELLQNELERQKAINQATVDTQEQERSEIGKELHDNVNQVLTTTKLYLDLALSNPELKDELIQKSTKNILSVINEIRQLSRSLMDPSIGDLGLIDSINDLIENINLTRKLHVSLAAQKEIERLLDKNHKLTIFRIIQEALNNAIRHAKATTVAITFRTYKGSVEISIQDDGIGFNPTKVKKGAGLKNIQNRIYLIDGTHSILSAPGKGCKIIISFPILN